MVVVSGRDGSLERLAALDGRAAPSRQPWIDGQIWEGAQFALDRLSRGEVSSGRCALVAAQFVIARAHGFLSWPKFASHLGALARTSAVSKSSSIVFIGYAKGPIRLARSSLRIPAHSFWSEAARSSRNQRSR